MSAKRRPATPLVLVVLSLTIWNAIRLQTALAWYDLLGEFAPVPGPMYTALSGALWLLIGCALLWSLWLRKSWAANFLFAAAIGYTVWYWIDRLVLQAPRANWPFTMLVNVILLAYGLALTIPHLSSNAILKRGV